MQWRGGESVRECCVRSDSPHVKAEFLAASFVGTESLVFPPYCGPSLSKPRMEPSLEEPNSGSLFGDGTCSNLFRSHVLGERACKDTRWWGLSILSLSRATLCHESRIPPRRVRYHHRIDEETEYTRPAILCPHTMFARTPSSV